MRIWGEKILLKYYFVGELILDLHIAGDHLLQFTASPLPGGLMSFTPAALHLLTYIKMSSSCTIMLTTVMQIYHSFTVCFV